LQSLHVYIFKLTPYEKIGIFYGSGTGTTGEIAERIAEKLGLGSEHVYDISSVDLNVLTQYDLLILGTSTWGSGDLQDDWDNAIGKVKNWIFRVRL